MGIRTNKLFVFWLVFFAGIWSCDTDRNIDPPYESHFIKYFGTDENESGVDMILLPDETLLLLGRAEGSKRIYLVKVDADGNLIWEKYIGSDSDVAKDLEPISNAANFIILSDYKKTPDNTDIKLIRIDPNGNKIDSVVYGSPENENSRSITALSDGGFIITGSTEYTSILPKPSNPNDLSDIFHLRCDASLVFDNVTWKSQYGPGTIDEGTKVFEFSPSVFYVFGYSNQDHEGSSGKTNLQYYNVGSGGEINAQPNFLGNFSQDTHASFVMLAPPSFGGGYFLIGTQTNPAGVGGLHVSKLRSPLQFESDDDVQLDQAVSFGTGTQSIEAVSAAPSLASPQGYLLLANETRINGANNISLSKIDQLGILQWNVSLGSEEKNDLAAAVTELSDGKIIVLGTVVIGDQTKMALFKLNSQGQLLK